MRKGKIGKALVLAAVFGLVGGRAAFAQIEDGTVAMGGLTDLAIGSLISTVGTDEQFADADFALLVPAGDPDNGSGSSNFDAGRQTRQDRGSCGNHWATDQADVSFHVTKRNDEGPGHFTVTEQFKNGTFTTNSGPDGTPPPTVNQKSPGACNNGQPYDGGQITPNVNGKDHGYATFDVACPALNPNCFTPGTGMCTPSTCDNIGDFVASHFPGGSKTLTRYHFVYRSNDPSLCEHKWIDSFRDGTTNQKGDIRNIGCGAEGEEGDGDGEIEGHGSSHAQFHSDEDAAKDGNPGGNNESYSDPNTGESFQSNRIDSVQFDDLAGVVTISGAGVNQLGLPVIFTIVEVPATAASAATYTITLSDGYTNTGPLLAGALSLF